MSKTYETIANLCKEKGINITNMCKNSGAPRGSLTDLKNGRIDSLSIETLQKIANFFNVSTDYLVSGIHEEHRHISDDDIKIALFGECIDDRAWLDVKNFVEFVRHKYSNS